MLLQLNTLTSFTQDRTRTTLTMEDLAAAMNEYGIDANRLVKASLRV